VKNTKKRPESLPAISPCPMLTRFYLWVVSLIFFWFPVSERSIELEKCQSCGGQNFDFALTMQLVTTAQAMILIFL